MEKRPLSVELLDEPRAIQDVSGFDISGSELLEILSSFDLYGLWRMDLGSGQIFWSPDVFRVHELEPSDGPVDMRTVLKNYHPEDKITVARLMDEAIEKRRGYRFVLRVLLPSGRYKLVKSIAKFRDRNDGELIGVYSQFALPMRSIATAN